MYMRIMRKPDAFRRMVRVSRYPFLAAVTLLAACEASSALVPEVADVLSSLTGMKLFVSEESPARRQADEWRDSRPQDAALMDRMASEPVAKWIGDWNTDVRGDVAQFLSSAISGGTTPVLVAYNIPNRDCGSYSAGGSADVSSYKKWIGDFAAGLSGGKAVVVLEPDAIAGSDCLSGTARSERFAMLRDAVATLKAANAVVYVDAGHAGWLTPATAADRLKEAGVDLADGFSLNVSNYVSTGSNVAYGKSVSDRIGGKHYVIDTSRNGIGVTNGDWCNVAGQALGTPPTTKTGNALVDAYLWIKQPGESDGTCNGGPTAGKWWAEYALDIAKRAYGA